MSNKYESLPIVLQLQYLAENNDTDLEVLLRKAKSVAIKLKIEDFKTWCDYELNGYGNGFKAEDLPDCRKIYGQLKAVNPYHGYQPVYIEDSDLDKILRFAPMYQPIGVVV